MFRKNLPKKPKKEKKKREFKEAKWVRSILIPGSKIPIFERIVKFLIYISLRLVIKPSKWKDPDKNFKIIDYTYKKIMSSDFIYIPSSISFYIIMSFMPILTLITIIFSIPGIEEYRSSVTLILGSFIPGMADILDGIKDFDWNGTSITGIIILLIISTWIASGGFAKLIYTQSHIFNFHDTGSYWGNRIKGMFIVILLTIILAGALTLNTIADSYLWSSIPNGSLKFATQLIVQFVVLFISIVLIFASLFKLSPTFRVKFKNILPGSFVAGVPTFIFLAFFGYITSLWSYSNYGVIAVIMYIGMASLFVSNFLFMGITTNAAYNVEFVEGEIISKRSKLPSETKSSKIARKLHSKNLKEIRSAMNREETKRIKSQKTIKKKKK